MKAIINMKKLLLLLLLSLGLIGNAYSELSGNPEVAKNALRCSALFYIQTAIPERSEASSQFGQIYRRIFGMHYEEYSGANLTYGDLSKAREKALLDISYDFTNESEGDYIVAKEFRHCAYWLQDIGVYLDGIETNFPEIHTAESAREEKKLWLSVPIKSSTIDFPDDLLQWEDELFTAFDLWMEMGFPMSFGDQLDKFIDSKE